MKDSMVLAVFLGFVVGLAVLLAALAVILLPAALLARFLRRAQVSDVPAVLIRTAPRELSGPLWSSRAHPQG